MSQTAPDLKIDLSILGDPDPGEGAASDTPGGSGRSAHLVLEAEVQRRRVLARRLRETLGGLDHRLSLPPPGGANGPKER